MARPVAAVGFTSLQTDMIEVRQLKHQYPQAEPMVFPDFILPKGASVVMVGESGSGKTTLLHLLAGLLKPSSGRVSVLGTELGLLSEKELDRFRARHFGFVFQQLHLIRALNVRENVMLTNALSGHKPREKEAERMLQRLGLWDQRSKRIDTLSHGQAQRVAIARAILHQPDVLFADEPTSSLDDRHCQQVIDLLAEVAAEHQSLLIIASHDQRVKSTFRQIIQL